MAANLVFISYKHERPWVGMAAKFRIKLSNYGDAWNLDYFIDTEQIDVGTPWRASVKAALAGCTHFLCLLCDTYWESKECRGELDTALKRRAAGESLRMAFVLAEPMKPSYLQFNPDGSFVGDVKTVGDFQFLGPYDKQARRVALNKLKRDAWGESIEDMLSTLKKSFS